MVVESATVLESSLVSRESVGAEIMVSVELQKELMAVVVDSSSTEVGALVSRLDDRRVVDELGRHGPACTPERASKAYAKRLTGAMMKSLINRKRALLRRIAKAFAFCTPRLIYLQHIDNLNKNNYQTIDRLFA